MLVSGVQQSDLVLYMCVYIYIGEGNGTPLQHPCLENPTDGGAWWAAVHGVTKSQTRLSFIFFFSLSLFHILFLCVKSLQSCLTLCDSINHSWPGSSVHGILQARILEWVAVPPSGGLPDPEIELTSLTSLALVDRFFTTNATWEAPFPL